MANIDLTQWGEDLPVQVVADKQHEIIDIIIGNDDLFIRQAHAEKLKDQLIKIFEAKP